MDKSLLARIGDAHLAIPEGFTLHPRVQAGAGEAPEMAYNGKIDWAFGELLALGSLIADGTLVRLSGQDTRRGTFFQRHSVLIDRKTGAEFTPAAAADHQRGRHPHRWQVPGVRLGAVGVRGGGLRVRLLGRQPGCDGAVGGAVRRLRQRRPVDHRRVHVLRRGQVGSAVRTWCCCCRTATRVRAPTTPRAASSGFCRCAPRAR